MQLYEATPEDFLKLAAYGGDTDSVVGVVRMQGLPFRATEDEIVSGKIGIKFLFALIIPHWKVLQS